MAVNANSRHKVIGVITNPASDNGKGERQGRHVVNLLRSHGIDLGFSVLDLTGENRRNSLHRAQRQAHKLSALIVVGGDGMVNLGINAVAHTNTPLGIVACGSGNDFARSAGLPLHRIDVSTEAIVAAVIQNSTIAVDIAHVTSAEDNGERVNTYIGGALNCSIDAAINRHANDSKLPWGKLRYAHAGFTEIQQLEPYGFRVTYTDPALREAYMDVVTPLLLVANSQYIGNGIKISPSSEISDGIFDVIWTKTMPTAAHAARLLAQAYHGSHMKDPTLGWQQVTDIVVDSSPIGHAPPTVMADGEMIGELPLRMVCKHEALHLLVPSQIAQSWNN